MENFFNYISKPIPTDEVDIWFKMNNILPEKLELFSDFSLSLYELIVSTYLGETSNSNETKISMTEEDNKKHFLWCWNKILQNFNKEGLKFNLEGEHFIYFQTFYEDTFYYQKEEKMKKSLQEFLNSLFDIKKPFTKSDLDMINVIYKMLDNNLRF